jgi:phage shock protein A
VAATAAAAATDRWLTLVQNAPAVVDEDPHGEGDQGRHHHDDARDLDRRVPPRAAHSADSEHGLSSVRASSPLIPAQEGFMPGVGGRFSTVIKAKISKLLDRAEDPGETLDYSYQKQLELLQNVKKGIAEVVTSKKRLQMQQDRLGQQVVKLDTQARQALAAGKEDLARSALERKTLAQTEMQSLDQQVAELQDQQEKLTASEAKLRTKIEAFRTKKEVVKAQYSAAEAQVQISEAATGVGEEMADVGLAMQRALDKTETMRARAAAVEELEAAGTFEDLTAIGPGEDDIDRQLKELTSSSQVDSELAKMKAELGSGGSGGGEAGQLEEGKS